MIRRPPRSTLDRSSAASDVYKRQARHRLVHLVGAAQEELLRLELHAVRVVEGLSRVDAEQDVVRGGVVAGQVVGVRRCLLYTSPSPRDRTRARMPSFACKKKKL